MATLSSVTSQHVFQAIAEYDERGDEQFLELYGFEASPTFALIHDGRRYDAQAVLGVAPGAEVPMPTLPAESMRIRSEDDTEPDAVVENIMFVGALVALKLPAASNVITATVSAVKAAPVYPSPPK